MLFLTDYCYKGILQIPAEVSYEGTTYAVTAIGEGAFEGRVDLEEVKMTDSILTLGKHAFAYSGIEVVGISQGVRHIPESCFEGCASLVSVMLPDSLKTIGVKAFFDSQRIRYIFSYNFGTDLVPPTFATFAGDPTDYGQAFSPDIWPDCMLVIPANMFMNYKSQKGWKNFRSWGYWHDYDVMPQTLQLSASSLTGREGATVRFNPTVNPSNATVLKYIITGANPDYVNVTQVTDENQNPAFDVTLLREGKTMLSVYCNTLKETCNIICDNGFIGVESITDSNEDMTTLIYFNMQGLRITAPNEGEAVIVCRGRKVTKEIYRR